MVVVAVGFVVWAHLAQTNALLFAIAEALILIAAVALGAIAGDWLARRAHRQEISKVGALSAQHLHTLSFRLRRQANLVNSYVPDGITSEIRYHAISQSLEEYAVEIDLNYLKALETMTDRPLVPDENSRRILSGIAASASMSQEIVACPRCSKSHVIDVRISPGIQHSFCAVVNQAYAIERQIGELTAQ